MSDQHQTLTDDGQPIPAPAEPRRFEPGRYLTKVGGAEYLEVKWRLVWLRDLHPDASIDTNLISHENQVAIFKAIVTLPSGASATGWGTEAYGDFRDYVEKAETKAIGRALAALGFGTQFCPDFDFGAGEGRVVDTPVHRDRRQSAREDLADRNGNGAVSGGITPRQVKFIQAIAHELDMTDDSITEEAQRLYGKPVVELGRRDASAFIERLQARRGPSANGMEG